MLTVEQALEAVARAAGAPSREVERVPLAEALGRVLAEDVAMDHAVPPFRRATMDGAGMLLHQGALAFETWTGVAAPIEPMRQALERAGLTLTLPRPAGTPGAA